MKRTSPEVAGFSLIELIVAMLITAILASIAIPAYSSYVRKSRRTEAKTAVLDLASLEERFFSVNNTYTTDSASLGYPAGNNWPYTLASGYYTIASPAITPPSTTGPATFTLTVTVVPNTDQAEDTQCVSFAVNSAGVQSASSSTLSPDPNTTCWR